VSGGDAPRQAPVAQTGRGGGGPGEAAPRRVTIREVAALAGVSIGTASKALNGQGKLRTETRDRVAQAARELGFAPNVLARGLLAGRTYSVGLITTDSFGRFSIPVMLGAEDALGAGQMSVFMCDTRDDPVRERLYLDMLLSRRVDGLIVTGRRIEPRPSIGRNLGVPVVYAMTQSLDTDEPAILPDDHGGGEMAARHLMEGGRTRLGHITGPERFLAARRRAGGFCAAAAAEGLRFSPADVLYGEWSERWGREGARILLASNPGVQAIFCGSDQIGRGVSDTLRQLGYRVPDDIALVGFDNWDPMVAGAEPPLSSIDMCLVDVGRTAAEHLLSAIGGHPTFGSQIVPCRLVIRGSSGTPPAAPGAPLPAPGAVSAAAHAVAPHTAGAPGPAATGPVPGGPQAGLASAPSAVPSPAPAGQPAASVAAPGPVPAGPAPAAAEAGGPVPRPSTERP
jgi:LacI family transcriptional regulator